MRFRARVLFLLGCWGFEDMHVKREQYVGSKVVQLIIILKP